MPSPTFSPDELESAPLTLCPRCGGEGSGVEDFSDPCSPDGVRSEHWTCTLCGGDGYTEDDGWAL